MCSQYLIMMIKTKTRLNSSTGVQYSLLFELVTGIQLHYTFPTLSSNT